MIAESLAAFAHAARFEDVPTDIVAQGRLHMLDTLGCAIAGARTAFADASMAALRRLDDGGGGSVAIGRTETLGLRDAVMFNAGIGHMLDFDDTHTSTLNHVSVGAVPMTLALAARDGATGADTLCAYLIAAEINCRIGLGATGATFLHRGVHPTGALNGFGNALAAARLMGLDAARMAHAQGLALSFAAGSMEWQRDGAEAKRLHPGNAAVAGLMAASYAGEGVTGPRRAYEGRAGIYRLFLGPDAGIDVEAITGGLGSRWAFADISIKPFPLVHHVHGVIDCALRLAREDGVRPETVARITARIAQPQIAILCEPADAKRNPTNQYQGIFSLYHTVAVAIARGAMTLAETEAALLDDPEIASLRQRIDYEVDPDSAYPDSFSGGVRVELTDGRVLERYEKHHPGSPQRPLANEAIIEKFRANAGRRFDAARTQAIIDTVLALDTDATPGEVMTLLGAP